jgi:hypothetical protein
VVSREIAWFASPASTAISFASFVFFGIGLPTRLIIIKLKDVMLCYVSSTRSTFTLTVYILFFIFGLNS